ncbi:MAG: hypothetical protein R3217_07610 [Gammaproteobacteria bacterium]|nr:hypothetical protein [Gammaproteobacteria bacterium]
MNEEPQVVTGSMDAVLRDQRMWTVITYVLHLLGAVLGLPSIIALIINYVQLDSATAEVRSHHRWQIRSFWWALLWLAVGWLLTLVMIGFVVIFAVWVWYLYRHIRGLVDLADYKVMPG